MAAQETGCTAVQGILLCCGVIRSAVQSTAVLQYFEVRCSTEYCGAVQCRVLYFAVVSGAVQCRVLWYCVVQCRVQSSVVQGAEFLKRVAPVPWHSAFFGKIFFLYFGGQ